MSKGRTTIGQSEMLRFAYFEISTRAPETNEVLGREVNYGITDYDKFMLRKMREGRGAWQPDGSSLVFKLDAIVFKSGETEYNLPSEELDRIISKYFSN